MRQLHFADLGAAPGCADMHLTRLSGQQASEPHTHDFYEAFLVLEGAGSHHLNRRKIPLRAGHLAVIHPDDAHWYSTAPGEELVFVNVAVSALWWQAFHALLGVPPWTTTRRAVLLDPVATRQTGAELSQAALTQNPVAVVQAWAGIHALFHAATRQRRATPPPWLEVLREKLWASPESLVEPISYWQRLAGRSPEHLARSCRRFYGVTFSELLNQARIGPRPLPAANLRRKSDDHRVRLRV